MHRSTFARLGLCIAVAAAGIAPLPVRAAAVAGVIEAAARLKAP